MSSMETKRGFGGLALLLKVRPEIQLLCRYGSEWSAGIQSYDREWASFHIVTRGDCVIEVTGQAPVYLSCGDVAILPCGTAHTLRSVGTSGDLSAANRIVDILASGVIVRSNVASDSGTEIICGRLRFEKGQNNAVLAVLPSIIAIRSEDGRDAGRIAVLIDAILDELREDRAGAHAVASDMASILMMVALRSYFETGNATKGLLALLADPHTGRAVAAMLDRLEHDWTLDDLAAAAQTSRSTFVRLFRKRGGATPLAFLSELRLDLAERKVLESNKPLSLIAREAGFQSQSAFHRAFQRRFGIAPGAHRISNEAAR